MAVAMNLMMERFSSRKLRAMSAGLEAPTRWSSAPIATPTRRAESWSTSAPLPLQQPGGEYAGGEDRGGEEETTHRELGVARDDVPAGATAGEPGAEDDEDAAEEGVAVARGDASLARV